MNFLSRIKRWPIEKKRIFSISLALLFTVIVVVINYYLNIIWKEEIPIDKLSDKNSPINTIEESFSKIFEEAKPALDQIFSSTSDSITATQSEIIEQINSTSTSFSTTSNIVE